jgi:uncharacterized protein (TIGR02599 family)
MGARAAGAFTLAELLVSTTILVVLTGILAAMLSQTGALWQRAKSRIDQFRQSRVAFEAITTRLSQATLNTYWDYDNPTVPTKYQRRSELRFASGNAETMLTGVGTAAQRPGHAVFFQTNSGFTETGDYRGFENTLNTFGYYVEGGDDTAQRPLFIKPEVIPLKYGFRIYELWQPTEANNLYSFTNGAAGKTYRANTWYRNLFVSTGTTSATLTRPRILAENVITLILIPRLSAEDEARAKGTTSTTDPYSSPLAPNYSYDSSPVTTTTVAPYNNPLLNPINQLPPVMQVTMVAMDTNSARKLNLTAADVDPFKIKDKFKETKNFAKDLYASAGDDSLERTLIQKKIAYRIFTTSVAIKAAKWSQE